MATKKRKTVTTTTTTPAAPAPGVGTLQRVFLYSGYRLADPGTDKSVEEVRDYYAQNYPEILNAEIKGPVTTDAAIEYTFAKRVGAKG